MSKLLFYPTLMYNLLMEKISSRTWYSIIDDTIILGALPFKKDIKKLLNFNVRGVISLNEPHELNHYFTIKPYEWQFHGIEFLNLPIKDFSGFLTQEQIKEGITFINKFKNTSSRVYIHCKAGRSRSATLVACYLISKYSYTPESAINDIKLKRPHIRINRANRISIQKYYKSQLNI